MTLLIGILSFFLLPPGPTQTKAWFRPNGWFSDRYVDEMKLNFWVSDIRDLREEIIIVNRYVLVVRGNLSIGS